MIQEKVIPQMTVASSQYFVNCVSDELIKQFISDFEKHLAETGAKISENQKFFTVFHVDEYREDDYNMELWMQIEVIKANTSSIQFKIVPQSEVAYIIVSENHENLRFTYDSLFNYVKERGYIINGYPRETYYMDDSAPNGYLTEIQLPFKRSRSI